MSEDTNTIVLSVGTDFTVSALAAHLNSVYTAKKSGAPFLPVDVQKYVERGRLPMYIGGNKLEQISVEKMGLKIVRILDIQQ